MVQSKTSEKCISCGTMLVERGYARFPCPNCGSNMGRCIRCRHQSNPFKCPECGFEGP